jgi:hypothetical protein
MSKSKMLRDMELSWSMRPSGSMSSRSSSIEMPTQQIRARGSMSSRSSIELPHQQLPSASRQPPQAKRTSIEILYSAPRSWRRSMKASVKAQLDIELARRLDAELHARLAAEIEMAELFAQDEERESDLETLRKSIHKRINTSKLQATGEASRSTNKTGRHPTEADEINRLIRASAADGFGNVLRERRLQHRASSGDNAFWTTFLLGARSMGVSV